jgi:cobalt-zinc-cadmium efflux system protein
MRSGSHRQVSPTGKLKTAFFINLAFTVIEIVGGILTNSVAILSDAVHDLGDSITLAASWQLEKLSRRGRTDQQTYGYRRYSLLGALISALILILGSVYILFQAIPRLFSPQPVSPRGMIALALLGIVVNTVAALRLRGGSRLNERVVFLHLMEDVLGWIAVLVISIVLLFTDIRILDPILSIVITVYILSKIFPILKSAFKVFLQYAPSGSDLGAIRDALVRLRGVKDVHDIHLWSLDGTYTVFSAHFVTDKDLTVDELEGIKGEIRRTLRNMEIHHTTIEFESSDNACEECDLADAPTRSTGFS